MMLNQYQISSEKEYHKSRLFKKVYEFSLGSSPKTYQEYKNKSPEETLQWILDLLKPHFLPFISLGLLPNEFGSTWFCRVALVDPEIGQNGKGITVPLAIVSGLAEFMERLQALCIFRNFSKNLPSLMMRPDTTQTEECVIHWEKFNSTLTANQFHHSSNIDNLEPIRKTLYRFYDVLNGNKPVYLDKSFAYTPFWTTGIAAGNSHEEATVQALCELFERFASRIVMENRIIVPSIPWKYLSERTQIILKEIQNSGFDIFIKDFSLNIGLPVVCIIIGTPELGYHARPGCATDINKAIERCILEFYQGIPSTDAKINYVNNLTNRWKKYYLILSNYLKSYFTLNEFMIENFLSAYDFPPHDLEFLTKDSLKSFKPWNYFNHDFFDEIRQLFKLCKKNNYNLYMRNISWMGFPTIHIISPELKAYEFNSIKNYVLNSEKLKQFQKLLLQGVDSIRTREFYKLIIAPEILFYCMILNPPRLDYLRGLIQDGPIRNINHWYFLGYVAYYFQNIRLSKCFFSCYKTFNPQDEYSNCLICFIELLPENPWDENGTVLENVIKILRNKVSEIFSSTIVEEIIIDFKNPKKILDIFSEVLNPCEECENCPTLQTCSYGRLVPLQELLEDHYSEFIQWEHKSKM